jgi:hydrogenase/urease accessory protein HupE
MDYVQLVLDENMPWWQVLVRSIVLGFEHIVPAGLDHILFVLGIYLAASRFRDLLWQVTAFTVAHSITLGLTASGVIVVGAAWERFVEIGIAISICTVAFENCLMRRPPGWRRILVVGGFGLIHGMGFAGRLSEVKWPPGTFFLSLFGANLGIELGQLAVIGAASLVTAWWWKCAWYQGRVAVTISLLIGLYGFFAALDRISQLSFPTQAATDLFWNFYDRYYWSIPLVIGALTLAICWMTYRLSAVIYTQALSRKGR